MKRELERERERGVPCNWATDVKGHVEHNFLANLKIFLGLGLSVLCELGIAFRTRSAFFFYYLFIILIFKIRNFIFFFLI